MLTSAKINFKNYTIYSLILLSLAYPMARSLSEYMVIVLVFIATCINHWMLIYVVRRLSEEAVAGTQKKNRLISIMAIGKLFLVVGALSFGVQIMGKRIIIPVLIYVLQIVVLYLSFEKQTSASIGS